MSLMFRSMGFLALLVGSLFQLVSAADDYDYIVIGSGPGGGPLAANLARANYTVLLLEGGDQSSGNTGGQYPPQITWDFFVKHYDDEALTLKHNLLTWRLTNGNYWVGNKNVPSGAKLLGVYYPRGGTVGGSSMINAMVTFLPSESDWNYIANITGDKTWKYVIQANQTLRWPRYGIDTDTPQPRKHDRRLHPDREEQLPSQRHPRPRFQRLLPDQPRQTHKSTEPRPFSDASRRLLTLPRPIQSPPNGLQRQQLS